MILSITFIIAVAVALFMGLNIGGNNAAAAGITVFLANLLRVPISTS